MPRLFLAVPLPNQIKTRLASKIGGLQKSLSNWNINWVAPENLHITLVFFGWVKAEQVEDLKAEVSAAVSGFSPFEVTAGKLSLKGRPLWLEIGPGRDELQMIAENLSKKLTLKGSLEEERGFHPHLTLGRVKKRGRTKLPAVPETFSWKANRIVLYESRFVHKQRIYEEVWSIGRPKKRPSNPPN
ncbi:2'-5' RNA ligase [candidate division WWE3 bacterium RIFCSPLOWO2_02_FULL_53_10]|uniref:RNA 2',3'-cyclic phosphodiesterase n=1 Tax=candidate division WWE3 bacterium RIFCSPLOWO2_02_FULL_53_10 TaxID=1802629 RepID=A0A1F4WC06_UNCKA|nr:MAG: 2'-5' RNA ligase [candidate division WWE3 bacterium RIFCSPLOWO2_02_FULL_53_10]